MAEFGTCAVLILGHIQSTERCVMSESYFSRPSFCRSQIDQLEESEHYALKVEARWPHPRAASETGWLTITPKQLRRIADILTEEAPQ